MLIELVQDGVRTLFVDTVFNWTPVTGNLVDVEIASVAYLGHFGHNRLYTRVSHIIRYYQFTRFTVISKHNIKWHKTISHCTFPLLRQGNNHTHQPLSVESIEDGII